ncbi:MAG TPA: TonB-dependent receptor [Vicinamibacterales bacterium]|nr:TonB-dependent receptor [Vicinamibacterales bacterium]
MTRLAASVLALGLSFPAPLAAQQNATVQGTVVDESRALLPGATVTATESGTGRQTIVVTNEAGRYRFDSLSPGVYAFRIELPGFGAVTIPSIELLVGSNATMPAVIMKVAGLEESITVISEVPLVDLTSSRVAGNIDRRQMEELPLQGRNWQELSLLIKGITVNNVAERPGVARDDQFQLNLDGQQITQRVAGSGFGQPKISREAIAEFQIVTNIFDITQGRSTGMQVQAISRSGTNDVRGSVFGFFRSDRLNAADPVAGTVLPFANQQTGATLGGPIIRSKAHFFGAYEYEREPSTAFLQPTRLPNQQFAFETKSINKNLLGRVDYRLSNADNLTVRVQRWDFHNPFQIASGTNHPSRAEQLTQYTTNVFGSWAHVAGDTLLLEFRGGYNGFSWKNDSIPGMSSCGCPADVPEYAFPGLTIGGIYNFPNYTWQDTYSGRFDLNWNQDRHNLKAGIEFLRVRDTKDWSLGRRGRYVFASRPSDAELERRFPADAWGDPSRWDLTGLEPMLQRFDINFHPDYLVDVPRPTLAMWIGDNWRMTDALSVNFGVRWDADWGAVDPPNVREAVIQINNGRESRDFGYKTGIRDVRNVAPRAGFAYNVGGKNQFVIRGGSGLYYNTPVSNVTYSHQFYSNAIAASFLPDGRPGFMQDPTRGRTADDYLSGRAPVPRQAARIISPDFKMPRTWQSSIGFQKQLGPAMSVDSDLVHWKWTNDTRTRDVNLFYDPATGYNRDPRTAGRPNASYDQVNWFESTGSQDYLALASGLTRRFQNGFQAGATYTFLFYKHDDGDIGYTAGVSNNPFDPIDGEWARSTDFQRNTVRLHATFELPYGVSASTIYFYGSGSYYQTSVATVPFGKPGTNRLNIGAPITIPESVRDRFDGPGVIGTNEVVPRNALRGLPLHKVDLRLSKRLQFGKVRVTGLAEAFNLFNRRNYGNYVGQVDSARFGQPAASSGNAYTPRSGQLGFRIDF